MVQSRINIQDIAKVLEYHGIDVLCEEDEITVWKEDIKRTFPIEGGFITKKFVHRIAQKFGIEIRYFFHPDELTSPKN